MGNQIKRKGRCSTASLKKQMEAYDKLPHAIRTALSNAYENWAPYPLQRRWEQGYYRDTRHLITLIAIADSVAYEKDCLARVHAAVSTTSRGRKPS